MEYLTIKKKKLEVDFVVIQGIGSITDFQVMVQKLEKMELNMKVNLNVE